jgi:hypothetical protein
MLLLDIEDRDPEKLENVRSYLHGMLECLPQKKSNDIT